MLRRYLWLIPLVVVVGGLGFYFYSNSRPVTPFPIIVTTTPTSTSYPLPSTTNWKSYEEPYRRYAFRYPAVFTLRSSKSGLSVISPTATCLTDVSGFKKPISANEVHLQFTLHAGSSFAQIWQEVFSLPFSPKYYQGQVSFSGQPAFYISSNSLSDPAFIRKAYLVELSSQLALEIEWFIPDRIFNCNFSLDQYPSYAAAILSTLSFPALSAQNTTTYSCPDTGWVDCMPGVAPDKRSCTPDYLQWVKANCPNFRGIAY